MNTLRQLIKENGIPVKRVHKGMVYVRGKNTGETLKVKRIDTPQTYPRATEDTEFSVTLESLSGNVWTEFFETEQELISFLDEKRGALGE